MQSRLLQVRRTTKLHKCLFLFKVKSFIRSLDIRKVQFYFFNTVVTKRINGRYYSIVGNRPKINKKIIKKKRIKFL